jgi:tyrosinase
VDTFPTWHRPYVALYEQLLASHFTSILEPYKNNQPLYTRLLVKAAKWRLPYLDWALFPAIPDEWATNTIDVLAPDGKLHSEPNPLFAYNFNPIDISFRNTPYEHLPTTLRNPDLNAIPPVSHNERASSLLKMDQRHFQEWIVDLFPQQPFGPDTWSMFASHSWRRWVHPGGSLTSLESIHDKVHLDIGGPGGHMSDPAVAAFDPIFWLHHCNVERLLTLWQATYPKTYVSEGPDHDGTKSYNSDVAN